MPIIFLIVAILVAFNYSCRALDATKQLEALSRKYATVYHALEKADPIAKAAYLSGAGNREERKYLLGIVQEIHRAVWGDKFSPWDPRKEKRR